MTKIAVPPAESLPETLQVVARTPGATGGHDFASLLTEVAGETNFKAGLVNAKTGAAGPFQFLKSTWLGLARQFGQSLGIKPELVQQIKLDAKGQPKVADPEALNDLLALRHDPVLAAKMAAKYMDLATSQLKQMLHRDPSESEVHLSFLLGPTGAAGLIHATEADPNQPVDKVVGSAATSNRPLFFNADGTPRTASESIAFLAHRFQTNKARATRYANVPNETPKAKIDA
jgi:hypothetical protein